MMTARALAAGVGLGVTGLVGWRVRRGVREELAAATTRLASVDRATFDAPFGAIEYAVAPGAGTPVLVSHGIFQGCDGALLAVRDILADRQVIAPSRFGYLGSTLPTGASPADQADAFAFLLDRLSIARADVLGISAGATAALAFASRHPQRVRRLIILSGNLPGGTTAVVQPRWAGTLYGDVPMWLLRHATPGLMARLAGVPAGYARTAADDRFLSEFLDSMFPIAARTDGIAFDAFVSNDAVNTVPLEHLAAPTLLIHAADDPLASYDSAQQAATRIPDAELLTLDSGGHLGLGQTDRIRTAIDTFLGPPSDGAPTTKQVPS